MISFFVFASSTSVAEFAALSAPETFYEHSQCSWDILPISSKHILTPGIFGYSYAIFICNVALTV